MTKLLRKNQKFEWSKDCNQAFEAVKGFQVSAPILTCLDFSQSFAIQTDASSHILPKVLTQQHEDEEKVISCSSRSLTNFERRFSTTEQQRLLLISSGRMLRLKVSGDNRSFQSQVAPKYRPPVRTFGEMGDETGSLWFRYSSQKTHGACGTWRIVQNCATD